MKTPQLEIFFDGGCKVCAWEVGKYVANDRSGVLRAVDILDPQFDAAKYGLNAAEVRRTFHVRTKSGEIVSGVEAFIRIWEALDSPWLRFAARAARFSLVRRALEQGYRGFVLIRPYLPRNAPACATGTCDLREAAKIQTQLLRRDP